MRLALVLVAAVLAVLYTESEACIGLGSCGCGGGGGGCAPPPWPQCRITAAYAQIRVPLPIPKVGTAAGACHSPPVPQPTCNCAPTHDCGRYGCYRRRAKAASVTTIEFETKNGTSTGLIDRKGGRPKRVIPDEVFTQCCIDRGLPDACISKCTFDTFSADSLRNMYFGRDSCPIHAAAEMQFCSAQGGDHRQCCAENGIAATLAGPKCLVFCDQRPGVITKLDMTYLPCYDRFESMKKCFWQDMVKHNFDADVVANYDEQI